MATSTPRCEVCRQRQHTSYDEDSNTLSFYCANPECGIELGKKHDSGKLRYGLIPPEATKAMAKVLTFGADKYGPNNWQLVEDAENRYIDALYRHLEAYRQGNVLDEDSKLPHLWHAITNIAFLIYFQQQPEPICMEPKIATPGEIEKIKEAINTGKFVHHGDDSTFFGSSRTGSLSTGEMDE